MVRTIIFVSVFFLFTVDSNAQNNSTFYFGHDLSYVNQMEDCGADFKRNGVSVDPFQIFADEGTNLVRARLWVDPEWWQAPLEQPEGVKPYYSDFEDVKLTFQRAKENGMKTLLNLHYSDFWADPGRQLIPLVWLDAAYDTEALADSVYQYTLQVLEALDAEGLFPDMVQVGNETNPGPLVHIPVEGGYEVEETVAEYDDWERHAVLYNAGIKAVKDAGQQSADGQIPEIALHWSGLSGLEWWVSSLIEHGVTDFDLIGFSYYYAWHEGSISELEAAVSDLRAQFPEYRVIALETAYLWSQDYGGIINEPDPEYLPVSPETQLEYLVDYTRAVKKAGGSGVIFWEPAWVDTPCVTPWQTGSSHVHVSFFDPYETNFMKNGGGLWTNREFYDDIVSVDDDDPNIPGSVQLYQNYPNPFNPVTTISFELPSAADVQLNVYDVTGRRITTLLNENRPAGRHEVHFNAENLASGIYIYRITAGDAQFSRRMVLVK